MALIALSPLAVGAQAVAETGGWEVINKESSVVVSRKYVPEYDLPIVRGVGVVHAGIYDVLAVLADTTRYADWMHSCAEARVLETTDDFDLLMYNRIEAPWPLADRDAVVRTRVKADRERRRVRISFESVSSKLQGEVPGVVRMPRLVGFYLVEKLSADETRVTYQAEADPGGAIPNWLVEINSVDIPLQTILSLRKRVAATKGTYTSFLDRWDPTRGGSGF